jgi:plastocyanin
VWFDVRNCSFDPIFDVPGGGKRGSTYSTSAEWTVPSSGRIVAALGHLHGGGKNVAVSQPDCNGREMFHSRPTWGRARDPEYTLRPRVHEPGPIDMELVTTRQGFPVAAGERLKLRADYDNEFPHTRVMGIMGLYIADDPSVTTRCAPLPDDVEVTRKSRPGRSRVPLMHVPINARRGMSAVPIKRPVGAATWAVGAPLDVDNFSVEPANAVIPQGATLRWRFWGDTLHTVTVADGPRGFSSPNLSEGREFSYRFSRPGTYKLYCSLHPVDMSSIVKVVRRG